ncbi:hypothetical protein HR45_14790 [Shewanella mangrovi]|uniref:Uncharacterized protein n=1 Tax=Shewanella mangrovi TaxID=1515746 RepID=A0A094J9W8_9GAMM|nr:hypothetical protein HR45_14790 [Shewanella mangrovi]
MVNTARQVQLKINENDIKSTTIPSDINMLEKCHITAIIAVAFLVSLLNFNYASVSHNAQ